MSPHSAACLQAGIALAAVAVIVSSAGAADFPLTADSLPQPGVAKGDVRGPFRLESRIYPGTFRDYWIYVPKQYDAAKPACVFVVQDGMRRAKGWHVATVLDNLIHQSAVPVQIGIFIEPGKVPSAESGGKARLNRSREYDALGGRYARFLIEEVLPEVSAEYNISDDANDAAVAGSSSGGICALNVAWERPDRFRRVFSGIGTFAALRGGDIFPTLIRKYENRPIRVFLQDGSNNASAWGGDGFLAGQAVLSALRYSGYDVAHVFGDGGHDDQHGAQVLPDALRFLWRDYPEPVTIAERPKSMFHVDVTVHGETWQRFGGEYNNLRGLTSNDRGTVFFCAGLSEIHSIDATGAESTVTRDSGDASVLAVDPNGIVYACETEPARIVRYFPNGNRESIVDDVYASGLIVRSDGSGYFTDAVSGDVVQFQPDGRRTVVAGVPAACAPVLSLDGQDLIVSSRNRRFTWAFRIQPDGSLKHGQSFGWLHLTDDVRDPGARSMVIDEGGLTYAATEAGLQILDGAGRPVMILDSPKRDVSMTGVTFGGHDRSELFVSCGRHLFKRSMKIHGKKRGR